MGEWARKETPVTGRVKDGLEAAQSNNLVKKLNTGFFWRPSL